MTADLAAQQIKRAMDIFAALFLLVTTAPLMAAIALVIRLDSRGWALFWQERIGKDGRPFRIAKFRTMVAGADGMSDELMISSRDPHWLLIDGDPRITHVGRLLRLTSLDELPQLWNVLRGDMSLVGPRPLIPAEHRRVPQWARRRSNVKPGLTGLWQVAGRTNLAFEEMVTLDCQYVSTWSLRTDLALILRTVPTLLTHRGAN